MIAPPTGEEVGDRAGWYCFTLQARLAEWDGTAWTGATHPVTAAPVLPGPPAPFAFARSAWFRWMVVGQALVILPAILSGSTGRAWWSWVSVIGYGAFMWGAVLLVGRFLHVETLDRLRSLTWIGIGSGVVAFGVGVGLEVLSTTALGWPTTLWLTGPIEEGGKLLVPFLLLVFGARRFAIPRVGLYLVLLSGATVGTLEGVEYQVRPLFPWAHLQMALLRPSAELLHVFVTGFAAAVIWLAAWRSGRAVTGAGAVAFLIAMAIHSVHDGVITFFRVDPRSFNATLARSLHEALTKGVSGGLFALGLAALLYLLARHGARELTPPGDIAVCPPPWRPQLKSWGYAVVATAGDTSVTTYGREAPAGAPITWWDPIGQPPAAAAGVPVAVSVVAVPDVAPPPRPPSTPPSTPLMAAPPNSPITPPMAPAGWYRVGGDPGLQAWWTGREWTMFHRWNGYWWEQW